MEKISGPKLGSKLGFLPFVRVVSIIFLDVGQDCSFGQCLTFSRAETSKKIVT